MLYAYEWKLCYDDVLRVDVFVRFEQDGENSEEHLGGLVVRWDSFNFPKRAKKAVKIIKILIKKNTFQYRKEID